MQYYILNSELEIVEGIEIFQSMIWTEKYWDIGDFELYVPASVKDLKLYTEAAKSHYYIVRAEDARESLYSLPAMMIDKVKLDDTYANGDGIIITGKQLKNVLSKRVVLNTKAIAGNIQEELYSLVDANAIHSIPDRVIPRLVLGDKLEGLDDVFANYSTDGALLSTVLTTACKDNKLGWDVRIDYVNKRLFFTLLRGVDRSHSQPGEFSTHNPYVVFSTNYNNLIRTTYSLDTNNYKNVAIVRSDYRKFNENTNVFDTKTMSIEVKPYKLDKAAVGLDRSEIFVENKDSTNEDRNTDMGTLTKLMETSGRTKLESYKSTISIDGEVAHNIGHKLGYDYFLGDLVTIQNEYGQSYDGRVTSVTINLSYNKNSVVPNFTIENYTGKEEEDKVVVKEEERRVTEDGQYRTAENGSQRQIVLGYIYRDRIDENGQIRITEDGLERSTTKCVNFDDEKYGKDVLRT